MNAFNTPDSPLADRPASNRRGWEFDNDVPHRGYTWWYLDAISADGRHGMTVIAFLGTVFSPWYALSRRMGGGDALNFSCMHVALYGRPWRWAMTDRRKDAVARGADFLTIGPSSMHWHGDRLTVEIDEITAPLPSRLRGRITLIPDALSNQPFRLDANGRHHWQPIAPRSHVEVAFDNPQLTWTGASYFDTNYGSAPLEDDFLEWDWCRAPMPEETAVLYNALRKDGSSQSLALRVNTRGEVDMIEPPPPARLPPGLWRVPRPARSDTGEASVARTLVDAPFYTRSEIRTRLLGRDTMAVHESLYTRRFDNLLVQTLMLPFRVPRALR